MTPDLPQASGGIKVMYRIVEELNASGLPAVVWHGARGLAYDDFETTAPVHRGLVAELAAGDVLVVQEVNASRWKFLTGSLPVVVLCQGWSFVLDDPAVLAAPQDGYPGYPTVAAVLATSDYVARVVRAASGPALPVVRIPPVVDGRLFRPSRKERVICYMPRRRGFELAAADFLVRRGNRLPGWSFDRLESLSEREVAARLGRAAVFMSGAEREGFGLPAAEALASGCLVVGFTGDGGAEFMLPELCHVVHDSDILGLSEAVIAASSLFEVDRRSFDDRVDRGRALVLDRYSRSRLRADLEAGFAPLVTAPDSPVALRHDAQVQHYQAHAPKPGALWGAYRSVRRTVRSAVDQVAPRR